MYNKETFLKTLDMYRQELGFNVLIYDNVVYSSTSICKRTLYEVPLIYVIFSVGDFLDLLLTVNFVKLLCLSMPAFPQIATSFFIEQIQHKAWL